MSWSSTGAWWRHDHAGLPHPRRAVEGTAPGAGALPRPLSLEANAQDLGFSISVDGAHVAGDPVPEEARQHQTDLSLARTDIQVKFDGLDVAPMLNVLPADMRATYQAGEAVPFRLDANYPAWIARAEIRIVDPATGALLAVIPATVNGRTDWIMPGQSGPDFAFTARVYDAQNRFDETRPLLLHRIERPVATERDADMAAGWGKDRTAQRSIPVFGGAVTVYGTNAPPGADVRALGELVPVDPQGAFVIQRLLPPGDHVVDVAVGEGQGAAMVFNRAINIPTDEWFYVAMADLTIGKRWGSGQIIASDPSEFDGIYVKGRTAFYLKGKIKGEYLLTAAGDTGEGPISEMLEGPLTKDPQALLRRIDPSQYYPVYGDDSVLVDDAPTHGKLYVRLERGPSHVMWGDFRTVVGEGSLFRSERVLYGASGHYESDAVTRTGASRISVSAYAAQPGTLPARDILRGTGGSAYMLRRQDIVIGSETVTIERLSGATGLVVSTQRLTAGTDYSINYLQGIVLLARPLNSTAPSDEAVSSAPDIVNLVVQYEYAPIDAELADYALGGSASVWVNDHLRVGVTGLGEKGEETDNRVIGGNVRLEASERTFIEAEILQSQGMAPGAWMSTDGGLTYVQQEPASGAVAYGFRLNAQAALDEVLAGTFQGLAGITVEGKEDGFSTLDEQVTSDQLKLRAYADIALGQDMAVQLAYEHLGNADRRRDEAGLDWLYRLSEDWTVVLGGRYLDQSVPGGEPEENGQRTDLGFRAIYAPSDDLSLYGFAQATVARSGTIARNDRVGAGGSFRLSPAWTVSAEGSLGTAGPGALALVTFSPHPDEETYLGFRLLADNAVDDFLSTSQPLSGVVLGTRRRLGPSVSVFAEDVFGLFDDADSLTQTYGVTLTPGGGWTVDGTLETGTVTDDFASDFERHALSLGARYEEDNITWSGRGEVRLESSADGSRDRETYLLQSGLTLKTSDDWRLLAGIDGVMSRSDQAAFLDGDFIQGTVGMAYRPVGNDRLNALLRYTYLYDLPGPDQVSASTGTTLGPAQRSHIFSADVNYDLTEWLTIGAKYGFRIGEVSTSRDPDDFITSSAHLGIVRADIAILEDWSLLLEQRALYQPETEMLDLGSLLALSYDFNDNLSAGVGYNFGRFSDDLSDLEYDDHGVFLNLTAKY